MMNVPSTTQMWTILKAKFGREILAYEFKQENGQRKLIRKLSKSSKQLPEGCEVFVGRLPRDLFEDELLVPFMKIGLIYEVRLMMNFSGVTRGFAFIKYFSVAHARLAIKKLNHMEIRPGHKMGVLPSMNHRNLNIGPVLDLEPFKLQEEELLSLLMDNTPGVEKVTLLPVPCACYSTDGKITFPLKDMLVQYQTHRDAAMARRILIPKKDMLFGGVSQVDWASPELLSRAYSQKK